MGASYFLEIYFKLEYHQIRVDPELISVTASIRKHEHSEFVFLPFGLNYALETVYTFHDNDVQKSVFLIHHDLHGGRIDLKENLENFETSTAQYHSTMSSI